jgi:hypothetical protein
MLSRSMRSSTTAQGMCFSPPEFRNPDNYLDNAKHGNHDIMAKQLRCKLLAAAQLG